MGDKKKVIIIGAGISGLTAGVYLLDNGYDVSIYEKHYIAGGECTGWFRDGTYIDGCAHWIVGTNPKSDLYPLWHHIGAINENTIIHETEYFNCYDVDGEKVTIYADLKKLEEELIRISPDDKKIILRLIKDIKAYQHVRVPAQKPIDMMNLWDLTKFGIHFLPMLGAYLRLWRTSSTEFAARFKSPILRDVFSRILGPDYNIHSLAYVMQALSKRDAGVIEGGSKVFADNVAKHFQELGGHLYLKTPIKRIVVENNLAKGVRLEDDTFIEADYVLASCDLHHTLYNLLDDKYTPQVFKERFDNPKDYPLNDCFLFAYKVTSDTSKLPKMINFKATKPIEFASTKIDYISIRNHSFDKKINDNCTCFTVLITCHEDAYDILKKLDKEDYKKKKEEIGNQIRDEIINYYRINSEDIKLIDVTTPLTYERYCNAYKGSYMSFITTRNVKGLMQKGVMKDIPNLFLSGQWLMSPGGLPIAVFTGKHAAIRICKKDKKKFVNLESRL